MKNWKISFVLFLFNHYSTETVAEYSGSYPGSVLQSAVDDAIARGLPSYSLQPGSSYLFTNLSLSVKGALNFTLDGSGSSLVFSPGFGVLVLESQNSLIRNLTVDYDPPCFTQGVIVAFDDSGRTVDVQLDPLYPSPNATDPLTSYFNSSEIKLQFWDGATRLRVPGQSGSCVVDIVGEVPGQARVWRVSHSCSVPTNSAGTLLATISPRIGATFDIPQFYRGQAWWVHNSENIVSEDITLLGSGNFAVLEWGGNGGHTYRRLQLTRTGTNLLSSNTDGFHSFSVGRGPHLDSCNISFMGDDAMNFHNRVAVVLAVTNNGGAVQIVDLSDVPSPDTSAPPASALADLVEGDVLSFMTAQQRIPHGSGVVLNVTRVTDPSVISEARALAAALPGVSVDPEAVVVWQVWLVGGVGASGISANDIVQFDRRACAGGLVENSIFTDAYDGVWRLQAQNTTARGNVWDRISYKLQIVYDPSWKEGSTDVANVFIYNNTFRNVLVPPATTIDEILLIDSNVRNVTVLNNTVYSS